MAVRYTHFDGYEVSLEAAAALGAARRAGIDFTLTDGRRSIALQWVRWRKWHNVPGHPVAFPSPNAPHVRVGSPNHCIDATGDVTGLVRWLNAHGANVSRPVDGEPWHVDPKSWGDFPYVRVLRGGMRGPDVRKLVGELMWLEYLPWPVLGRPRSYFGGWVNTAVRAFQRDHHLPDDGVVGERTATVLKGTVAARKRAGHKPRRRPPLVRRPR